MMTNSHDDFHGLDQEQMISQRLVDKLTDLSFADDDGELQYVELHEGEVLFKQGDEAQSMFVLKAGALAVQVRHDDGSESTIARMGPGAIVGEMALLSGSKRSATIMALNDAGLICITRERFEQLMLEDELALAEMSETAVPRWQRQQLVVALRSLLGDVDADALEALRQQMTWHFFGNGDVVFLQGDDADGMYIVINGRLRVSLLQEDGSVKEMGLIGPGEPVGEMAVITEAERSATVHAIRDSNLVRITSRKFQQLIRQHPKLLINITRVIIERQHRHINSSEGVPKEQLNLVVIPASLGMDAMHFAQKLGASLSRQGSVLTLDSGAFDERYGEEMASQTELEDVGNTAVVAYMSKLDLAYQYNIFVADPFASAWTWRCIGYADRALVLADMAGDPKLGDAEQLLDDLAVPIDRTVLFWHKGMLATEPDVTAWLAARPGSKHRFVKMGNEEDLGDQISNNR